MADDAGMAGVTPEVEIGPEVEGPRGWSYEVTVYDGGRVLRHAVTLSFPDYDLWSRGQAPPSRVVRRVMRFLHERGPADRVPRAFDCSTVRRQFPEIDTALSGGE